MWGVENGAEGGGVEATGAARQPSIVPYRNGDTSVGHATGRECGARVEMRAGGGEMGRNGGRARCPHRAVRVMRVSNGSASRETWRPSITPYCDGTRVWGTR